MNVVLELRSIIESVSNWPVTDQIWECMKDRDTEDKAVSVKELCLAFFRHMVKRTDDGKTIPTLEAIMSMHRIISKFRKWYINGCIVLRPIKVSADKLNVKYSLYMSFTNNSDYNDITKKTQSLVDGFLETENKEKGILKVPYRQRLKLIKQIDEKIKLKNSRKERKRRKKGDDNNN